MTAKELVAAWIASAIAMAGCAHHDHHEHRFENAEEWAKVWDDPSRDTWQKPGEVIALLALDPGMTVADLGAGTGYFLPHLSRAVGPEGRVLGLDIEPDMVRHMNERAKSDRLANVEARQVAPDDAGLADGSVDRILVVDTWHHIADRTAYTRRLARSLRPGGRIVVVDHALDAEEGPPREIRIAPEAVVAELEDAGLQARVLEEGLPRHYVVEARR